MKILAIETSTRIGSVALLEDAVLLGETTMGGDESHTRRVLPSIRSLLDLKGVGIGEIDGIAVGIGPGSFTGLRIGLSVAKGLGFSLGCPVIGIPSLEALAMNAWESPYDLCPMFDARKGEVYAALYRWGRGGHLVRIRKEMVCSPDRFVGEIARRSGAGRRTLFLGDGALLYGGTIRGILAERAVLAPAPLAWPRASHVGLRALRAYAARLPGGPDVLEPTYLRPSEAEIKRKKNRHQGRGGTEPAS